MLSCYILSVRACVFFHYSASDSQVYGLKMTKQMLVVELKNKVK